ncbi:DUF4388 domain-containing protein [Cryptosporangium aurantiacum]|uniref:PatA-like N-terminal domain-containing protein n=1 Tax=Cryptosporangium aurantiacum TaxID=134849 RepID=A0A1M7QF79_9ACTN|nr:DUF4388 domain-containing protein [Cryptosporangium aurantiacum]SHN29621.1 hypothetical protein SAMN05443668_104593 [Cryptosporangium aurantiacum]
MSAVETALRELATLGATGALHVEAGGGGAVLYLHEGRVGHIDAEAAPGIGAVLTASGRLSTDVWESVLTVGAPSGRVGALLVEQGYLSQGELELCVNGALFDAAFFALGAEPTSVRFAADETSWFGGALRVDVERLVREVAHRRELLTTAFPSSEFDEAPLVLASRLPRDQVVVDGLRWELLLNADGRRTPLDLARQLGRGGFAMLLEVRRLAAIGLVQPPSATGAAPVVGGRPAAPGVSDSPASGAAGRPAVTAYRPAIGGAAAKNGRAVLPHRAPPASAQPASPRPGAAEAGGGGLTPLPPLPRRTAPIGPGRVVRPSRQGRPPEEPAEASAPADDTAGPRWPSPPPEIYADPPTLSSLRRFRDALQEFS